MPANGRISVANPPTGPTGLLTVDGLLAGRRDAVGGRAGANFHNRAIDLGTVGSCFRNLAAATEQLIKSVADGRQIQGNVRELLP